MNNKDFLKNLKVGDFVFIKSSGLGASMRCVKVEKITPKRGDIIAGGLTFGSDGYTKSSFSYTSLIEYNEENKKEYKILKLKTKTREVLETFLIKLKNNNLSERKMEDIVSLLSEEESNSQEMDSVLK